MGFALLVGPAEQLTPAGHPFHYRDSNLRTLSFTVAPAPCPFVFTPYPLSSAERPRSRGREPTQTSPGCASPFDVWRATLAFLPFVLAPSHTHPAILLCTYSHTLLKLVMDPLAIYFVLSAETRRNPLVGMHARQPDVGFKLRVYGAARVCVLKEPRMRRAGFDRGRRRLEREDLHPLPVSRSSCR